MTCWNDHGVPLKEASLCEADVFSGSQGLITQGQIDIDIAVKCEMFEDCCWAQNCGEHEKSRSYASKICSRWSGRGSGTNKRIYIVDRAFSAGLSDIAFEFQVTGLVAPPES